MPPTPAPGPRVATFSSAHVRKERAGPRWARAGPAGPLAALPCGARLSGSAWAGEGVVPLRAAFLEMGVVKLVTEGHSVT